MSCRLVTVSFPPSLHHAPCAVRSEHPLAQLYCHSTLEHHHFDQCLMVLNSPVSTLRAAGRGLCRSSRTFTSWIHAQRRKGRARFIPFRVRKAKPQHRGPRSLAAPDDQRSLCRLIRDIGLLASTRLFQVTPVRPETRVPRRVPLLRGEGPSAAAVGAARQCHPQVWRRGAAWAGQPLACAQQWCTVPDTLPGKDDSGSVAFVSIVNALTLLGCVRCSHYPLRVISGMKRDHSAARLHEHSAPGQSQHPRSPRSPRGVSCPPSPREHSGGLTLPATFSSYFSSRHTE